MTPRSLLVLFFLAGCEAAEPDPDDTGTPDYGRCGAAQPELQVARAGDPLDGESSQGVVDIFADIPPQGGAPYAPFQGRLVGLEPDELGFHFTMSAVDADSGEELGSGDYTMRWVCANVGEHANWYVGAELHLRFFGWETSELDGRNAEITIRAENEAGDSCEQVMTARLWDGRESGDTADVP